MLKISNGKIDRAVKTVVYGSEGIGKSTFASKFPDPLFIDTEGGTAQMDVRRIEKPESWDELLSDIREVAAAPDICKTLVIDTADWSEQLCVTHVCVKYKQNSIESFGYGKGYTYLAEEWARFLAACDEVIASGKNVVIVAHAKQRKQELPDEAGAFDRWEMKLSKQVAPLLKEWADLLLFLNYRTYVVTTETNSKKAQGGKRVMFASHHPCWDAKNRHGLPDEMDLDFANIAHIFEAKSAVGTSSDAPAAKVNPVSAPAARDAADAVPAAGGVTADTLARLSALITEADVTEADVQKVVASRKHYAADVPINSYSEKFVSGWLIKYWPQIVNLINADRTVKN